MGKIPFKYLTVHPWKIIEDGYHPKNSRVSESLFSLGNEHMGIRGFFDEGYSGDSLIGCYLNGVFERHRLKEPLQYKGIPDSICFMINTVNWLYTRIMVDDEILDLNSSLFENFVRELDFKTGELKRSLVWKTGKGKSLKLVFSRSLSMTVNELCLQTIELEALDFSGNVSVTFGLDFSVIHENYRENYWECRKKGGWDDSCAILGQTRNTGQFVFAGFNVESSAAMGKSSSIDRDKFIGCSHVIALEKGKPVTVDRLIVVHAPRQTNIVADKVWFDGMALLEMYEKCTLADLREENRKYWDETWKKVDIEVEGDDETQQGIRYCIFQLQQTYRGAVEGSNIGAKGLTGEVYNGNAFWDTETYCLPFYLFNNPRAAKALLNFRYETLPAAVDRARQLDCEGACFPIATIDGTECCTLWQHSSLQFQTTTGVAYGIEHYVKVTGDNDFLYSKGIKLLIPICRFLASRGQWSERRNKFGYYAVMGPDEFQMMVNNNCYTNFMARQSFLFTLNVIDKMEEICPDKKQGVFERTGLTPEELADWKNKAENMLIPKDKDTKVYEQHEGFFDLPHIDIDKIPVTDFPLYHHWSYDRLYRNDIVKQPDVLMFLFLYNQSFPLEEKRANYDYYEPRCLHESSLSPSVHSILANELGRYDEAFEFFKFATRIDLDDYNRNTREGIHITSIAAAWMNIVYGFGGLRSDSDELVLNPTIPEKWKSYSFRLFYMNSSLLIHVDHNQVNIRLTKGSPVFLKIRNQVRVVDGAGLVIPMVKKVMA
ncbi:MAG: family 65 glycosyl hydrolase [Spirochaetales bacterium]|nr:family 65 glycosyl hydrolase [Spirochaetales bacterium]